MANGKPGDHPVSDVVVYGMRVYSRSVDDLIRRIWAAGAADRLSLLLVQPPWSDRARCDLVSLRRVLQGILDETERSRPGGRS